MKNLFYLIVAAGFIMISCAKTDEKPQPNEEHKYSFSIGAEKEIDKEGAPETRIEIIDGAHHWSVGDKVGMFVFASSTALISNVAMIGQHTEPTKSGSFIGELTESQITRFNPNSSTYHSYFTYFPYNANITYTSSTQRFFLNLPETMTIRKNEFPSDYALMFALANNKHALTWLDGNGKQQRGERIAFNYKHVLSYLRVRLDINLMSLPVTKIEITSGSVGLLGDIYLNRAGAIVLGGGRNVTINIPEGMDVGDEIYVPLLPNTHTAGLTFRFTFSNGVTYEKVVPNNLTMQQGKTHGIAFKLPFIADFQNSNRYTPPLPNMGQQLRSSFDFAGHTYLATGLTRSSGGIQIAYPYISTDRNGLATPPLNLGGKTSVPVQVKATITFSTTNNRQPNSQYDYIYIAYDSNIWTNVTLSNSSTITVPITTRGTGEYSTPIPASSYTTLASSRSKIRLLYYQNNIHTSQITSPTMILNRLEVHPL